MNVLSEINGSIVDHATDWSAEELGNAIDRIRKSLQDKIDNNSRVAIAVENQALFMASVAAVRSLGAVAVLLSSRFPCVRDKKQLIAHLKDSESIVAIVDEPHAEAFTNLWPNSSQTIFQFDQKCIHLLHQENRIENTPNPKDAALICYTSGTEGLPKGVVLSENTLRFLIKVNAQVNQWCPHDRFLSALPLSHMTGFVNLATALTHQVCVVVSPSFMWPAQVVDTCHEHRVTVAGLVPHYLSILLRQKGFSFLTSLRLTILSAAPIVPADVEKAHKALPTMKIVNAYGLTEAFRSLVLSAEDLPGKLPSIGRPVPGVQIELRDQAGIPLKSCESRGIAWVRGPNVMLEYWKNPNKTAAVLREGWFCTSDVLECREDGAYQLYGRKTEIINGGGEKISSRILEQYIAKVRHILEVAVIGLETGSSYDDVVAVIRPKRNVKVTLEAVRAACAPHVHSVFLPKRIIHVKALPRTTNGKVDRNILSTLAIQ